MTPRRTSIDSSRLVERAVALLSAMRPIRQLRMFKHDFPAASLIGDSTARATGRQIESDAPPPMASDAFLTTRACPGAKTYLGLTRCADKRSIPGNLKRLSIEPGARVVTVAPHTNQQCSAPAGSAQSSCHRDPRSATLHLLPHRDGTIPADSDRLEPLTRRHITARVP